MERYGNYKIGRMSSKTQRISWRKKCLADNIDGLEACAQAAHMILSTERYKYLIYSWNYGVELESLEGQPIPLILADLPRRITEALLADDRFLEVSQFELEEKKKKVSVKAQAKTVYGWLEIKKEVAT
ncbi:MAG: DUF2634 domain-containing protein [Clostridiales bacterium]|nr:DUF2634 domain-containing protein [Clostridiales bacterium]